MRDDFIKTVIITGPTATGKTAMGCKLALLFNGEIISADSRQVYGGLDLGTGKDLSEYNREGILYHLIDIIDPRSWYNLRQFNCDAYEKISEISSRNRLPFIVGGTPLYVDSLISEYNFPLAAPDHELRKMIESHSVEEIGEYLKRICSEIYERIENKLSRPRLIRALEDSLKKKESGLEKQIVARPRCQWLILGPLFDRKTVHKRIELRFDERLNQGMIEEVANLNKAGVSWERLYSFGLEYRYISMYLEGKINLDEMRNTLLAKIRGFARSQDVWFRKMERAGHRIHWILDGDLNEAKKIITAFLENKNIPEPAIRLKERFYGKKTEPTPPEC